MTILKTIGIGIAGVVVGLLLAGAVQNDNVGGVYNTTVQDFAAGITYREMADDVIGDRSLRLEDSGETFYVKTNFSTTTLPAIAGSKGTIYRFVISSAVSTGDYRIVSREGDNIEGSLIVAGAVVDCDAADRVNFVTDGENIGDYVEIRSDGTYWHVTQSNALTSAKLTCSG